VFAGEVVIATAIVVAAPRLLRDAPREGPAPRLDWIGSLLSAAGIGSVVLRRAGMRAAGAGSRRATRPSSRSASR
jgi:hypothetical protein